MLFLSALQTIGTVAVIAVVALIIMVASLRIVKQSTAVIVERLGKYNKTLDTGVHFILPFFDWGLPSCPST